MTDQQEVPEALRLAEQYDYGDPVAHSNMWKAAVCTELRRQHTRISELKAQLEAAGAGGVQALGAAPAGWKLVPVEPTPEMWKAAKTVPDPNPPYPPHYGLVWDAMLTASPTPPAEQQAAPQPAPAPLSERDAFENAYAKQIGMAPTRRKHHPDLYMSDEANTAWHWFQVGAALVAQGENT